MKKDPPLVVDRTAADKMRLSAFVFLLALSVVAGYGSLIESARLALNQDAFTYIPLVLMLSVAFLYLRWHSVRNLATYSVATGAPLLVIAAGIALGGYFSSSSLPDDALLSVRMAALAVWWVGAFTLCFGWKASRVALFPLVFLFAVVPLPAATRHPADRLAFPSTVVSGVGGARYQVLSTGSMTSRVQSTAARSSS